MGKEWRVLSDHQLPRTSKKPELDAKQVSQVEAEMSTVNGMLEAAQGRAAQKRNDRGQVKKCNNSAHPIIDKKMADFSVPVK